MHNDDSLDRAIRGKDMVNVICGDRVVVVSRESLDLLLSNGGTAGRGNDFLE